MPVVWPLPDTGRPSDQLGENSIAELKMLLMAIPHMILRLFAEANFPWGQLEAQG